MNHDSEWYLATFSLALCLVGWLDLLCRPRLTIDYSLPNPSYPVRWTFAARSIDTVEAYQSIDRSIETTSDIHGCVPFAASPFNVCRNHHHHSARANDCDYLTSMSSSTLTFILTLLFPSPHPPNPYSTFSDRSRKEKLQLMKDNGILTVEAFNTELADSLENDRRKLQLAACDVSIP